jgi:mannose/fructose/N-acetylgalactosamine-specific phosphotransferase system component IID
MGVLEIARGLLALLFLQTSWSYAGRQGLGLKFVLLAVARKKDQRLRIMEHCRGVFNTNPFVAGAVVGTIVRAEYEVQELRTIDRFAETAQATLAAGGDRFFWQTLRPALSALAVLLGLFWSPVAPLGFLIAFNGVSQGSRVIGLRLGYTQRRNATPVLQKQFDKWTHSLSMFAALITGMILTRGLLGEKPLALGMPLVLTIPIAAVSYFAIRRNVNQTYLLIISLLIFLALKLILPAHP